LLTDSANGFLFSRCLLWQDYKLSFEFKIVRNCIGWVVRARDLSNYIMLQCCLDGINPHIKTNGMWWIKRHGDTDVNLTFDDKLNLDEWYNAKIHCEKSQIKLQIFGQNQVSIFDRMWEIPDKVVVSYLESPESKVPTKTIVLPVDLDVGTIGFRCWGYEKSLVRDLLVKRISL